MVASQFRVVIVGAGPTGATLALLLSQRGISVTLVESARNFRRAFRGEALMPSGLQALAQMDLLALVPTLPHRPLDGWEFVINDRRLFLAEEPFEPDGPPCTLISQPAFLEAVVQRCQAGSQFEFLAGQAAQDLLWGAMGAPTPVGKDDRVSGIRLRDGRAIAADLVIATEGRQSLLRQRAQLALTEAPHDFDLLWFQLPDHPHLQAHNIFTSYLKDRQAFGLFRSAEGNLQVGLILPSRTPDRQSPTSELGLQTLMAAAPPWLAQHCATHAATIEKPTFLPVRIGLCAQWSRPGFLLLGDAAHPMSPIRAQGINMALRDAIVAANVLVPILTSGDLASSSPDSLTQWHRAIDAVLPQIQAARYPEIQQIQKLQAEETQLATRLRDNAGLRSLVSGISPWCSQPIKTIWQQKQRSLRQGTIEIRLTS
ncbi:MAG: FAD-dependent monooxygenase [Synechococcales bacterium]|nr:FAD-dependent monooxygenase [Synechococcales bacterium]